MLIKTQILKLQDNVILCYKFVDLTEFNSTNFKEFNNLSLALKYIVFIRFFLIEYFKNFLELSQLLSRFVSYKGSVLTARILKIHSIIINKNYLSDLNKSKIKRAIKKIN